MKIVYCQRVENDDKLRLFRLSENKARLSAISNCQKRWRLSTRSLQRSNFHITIENHCKDSIIIRRNLTSVAVNHFSTSLSSSTYLESKKKCDFILLSGKFLIFRYYLFESNSELYVLLPQTPRELNYIQTLLVQKPADNNQPFVRLIFDSTDTYTYLVSSTTAILLS